MQEKMASTESRISASTAGTISPGTTTCPTLVNGSLKVHCAGT